MTNIVTSTISGKLAIITKETSQFLHGTTFTIGSDVPPEPASWFKSGEHIHTGMDSILPYDDARDAFLNMPKKYQAHIQALDHTEVWEAFNNPPPFETPVIWRFAVPSIVIGLAILYMYNIGV